MSDLLSKKKHITEITNEFKPYWDTYFASLGITKPFFCSKLGYTGSEFESVDGSKTLCVRFFANELSNGQDVYVELFDWEQEYYFTNERVLFKLEHNPNWKLDSDNYIEITKKNDGTPLPVPSYAVRVSNMVKVSSANVKELGPEINVLSKTIDSRLFEISEPTTSQSDFDISETKELDDAHYAQMTIRDIYCIIHNKPLSNKKWLNNLIKYNK
jgi:hypothetical protein